MQEILNKIMAIVEAQDAKIKALEAQIEASGTEMGDIVDVLHGKFDDERYGAFTERHKGKFEPYLSLMDQLEGGDAFRSIYDKAEEFSGEEGYNEDAYIDGVLSSVVETINSLKAVVPPEAQPALETAEQAIAEAAVVTQTKEVPDAIEEDTVVSDPAPDAWSEEDLAKEELEGPKLFE